MHGNNWCTQNVRNFTELARGAQWVVFDEVLVSVDDKIVVVITDRDLETNTNLN